MSSVPFTFRIDSEMKADLEAAAIASDRTPGYLAKKAVADYLEAREEKRRAIGEALEEAKKGYLISSESMHRWMDSWGTENELPRPEIDISPKDS